MKFQYVKEVKNNHKDGEYIDTGGEIIYLKDLPVFREVVVELQPINLHTFVSSILNSESLYCADGSNSPNKLDRIFKSAIDFDRTIGFIINSYSDSGAFYFTETQLKDAGIDINKLDEVELIEE